jgi:hypothetical protein
MDRLRQLILRAFFPHGVMWRIKTSATATTLSPGAYMAECSFSGLQVAPNGGMVKVEGGSLRIVAALEVE